MADEAARMKADVVIVGAGPGGMSAAAALSGNGLKTVVVERLSEAGVRRYHSVCGEAVSERSFSRLGWRPGSIAAEVSSISISIPGGPGVRIRAKGAIVDRPGMLSELRAMSDAEFITASVQSVSEEGGGYIVGLSDGRSIRTEWLIGADGAHSIVRKAVFGRGPTDRIRLVNCIAEGDGGSDLSFFVEQAHAGGYGWRFPSHPGRVSVGFPVGTCDPRTLDIESWGARDLPFGVLDEVARGRCLLVGDAACLANPLCYGGIAAAMISGKKAAEAVLSGDPDGYGRWIARDPMFDRRFMDAHRAFCGWTDDEISDALAPFRRGPVMLCGLYAMIRRPKWARIYFSVFMGLRYGWRCCPIVSSRPEYWMQLA